MSTAIFPVRDETAAGHTGFAELHPAHVKDQTLVSTVKNVRNTTLPAPYLASVCQIHVTRTPPNHSRPWVKERSIHSTGSGFVVEGRLILTNAHCISYASVIKVQRHMSDEKFVARVVRVSYDCDVAVLTVDKPKFWRVVDPDDTSRESEIPALQFGPLPGLQDTVRVIGYPVFGTEISITQGVVSRIQLQRYSFSDCTLLSVQTDGCVNPGNSGGPVLNSDDLVVGIAFQASSSANTDSVGEFIPNAVFENCVLKSSASNGEVIPVAGLGFRYQKLESPAMRASLGMNALDEPNDSGVYVNKVSEFGSVAGVLLPGDVIVEAEGPDGTMISIGNQGTIPFRSFRVGFSHLFSSRSVGDLIKIGVVRGGERIDLEYELGSVENFRLVPEQDKMKSLGSDDPEYVIIGGLVFIGLNSYSLSSEWEEDCPDGCLTGMKHKDIFGTKLNEDHEVVLLSLVLHSDVNAGFEHFRSEIVESFNGVRVNSVTHLAEMWSACTDEYVRFDLPCDVIVVNRQEAVDSEREVLAAHNIPKPANIKKRRYSDVNSEELVKEISECTDSSEWDEKVPDVSDE